VLNVNEIWDYTCEETSTFDVYIFNNDDLIDGFASVFYDIRIL
jgi:hypothetical protein